MRPRWLRYKDRIRTLVVQQQGDAASTLCRTAGTWRCLTDGRHYIRDVYHTHAYMCNINTIDHYTRCCMRGISIILSPHPVDQISHSGTTQLTGGGTYILQFEIIQKKSSDCTVQHCREMWFDGFVHIQHYKSSTLLSYGIY